eukprot:g13117.t1
MTRPPGTETKAHKAAEPATHADSAALDPKATFPGAWRWTRAFTASSAATAFVETSGEVGNAASSQDHWSSSADVATPTANDLQSLADLCPNEKTTLQHDISERIVPEENVFLVAPRCPIEYIKGYRAVLFPNSPRVTCFDHAAADKSIDLISDFLEAEGGVKFFEADDPAANTSLRAAYRSLNPRSYRADLWRAAILYYCGGLYIDAKVGIAETGLSRDEIAATEGVFENLLRPNRGTMRGSVSYSFAAGELALCYDRWRYKKNEHGKHEGFNIMTALIASYPRNPSLLYILRAQIENIAHARYEGGALAVTGPAAFKAALGRHECHRHTFVPRCGFVSLQEDVFPADGQGERLREELHCGSSIEGSRCRFEDRYFAMLPDALLSRYVQPNGNTTSSSGGERGPGGSNSNKTQEDLCSHARLLQDLPAGGSVVEPKIDKVREKGRSEEEEEEAAAARADVGGEGERHAKPLLEVLAEELEREGRFSARVLNATRGALLVGWTPEMHTGVKSGKGAESLGGPEKCGAGYASLFGKHKIYCSDLDGGEHGADPCNVACRDNSKVAGSAAEGGATSLTAIAPATTFVETSGEVGDGASGQDRSNDRADRVEAVPDEGEGFDIDVVIPYVMETKRLKEKFEEYCVKEFGAGGKKLQPWHRLRDLGTLEALLLSIERYLPFVRKVHVVSNGELPKWLSSRQFGLSVPGSAFWSNKTGRLRFVTHEEIWEEASINDDLPTFNSCAIFTQLVNVPDLAERFVYAEDDMMFLRPILPSDLFDFRDGLGGRPYLLGSADQLPRGGREEYRRKLSHDAAHAKCPASMWLGHQPIPLRKTDVRGAIATMNDEFKLATNGKDLFALTRHTRCRSETPPLCDGMASFRIKGKPGQGMGPAGTSGALGPSLWSFVVLGFPLRGSAAVSPSR